MEWGGSSLRSDVLSCAHYFQAPATQARRKPCLCRYFAFVVALVFVAFADMPTLTIQLWVLLTFWVFLTFLTASWQHSQSHGFLGKIILKWNEVLPCWIKWKIQWGILVLMFEPCWDLSINSLVWLVGFISGRNDVPLAIHVSFVFFEGWSVKLRVVKESGVLLQQEPEIMHGSILLVTIPPTRHLQFVLSRRSIHHPRDNSPPPSSWSTSYTIFSTSFSSVQKQNNTFWQLLWMFSWLYCEKDNGCHNTVKTWTINLKTKKKSSLSASLREHVVLDQISVSL